MVQRVKMPSNLGRKNSSKRYLEFMSSIVEIQQQSKRLLYGACVNGMRTHVLKCHSIQIKIGKRNEITCTVKHIPVTNYVRSIRQNVN